MGSIILQYKKMARTQGPSNKIFLGITSERGIIDIQKFGGHRLTITKIEIH